MVNCGLAFPKCSTDGDFGNLSFRYRHEGECGIGGCLVEDRALPVGSTVTLSTDASDDVPSPLRIKPTTDAVSVEHVIRESQCCQDSRRGTTCQPTRGRCDLAESYERTKYQIALKGVHAGEPKLQFIEADGTVFEQITIRVAQPRQFIVKQYRRADGGRFDPVGGDLLALRAGSSTEYHVSVALEDGEAAWLPGGIKFSIDDITVAKFSSVGEATWQIHGGSGEFPVVISAVQQGQTTIKMEATGLSKTFQIIVTPVSVAPF